MEDAGRTGERSSALDEVTGALATLSAVLDSEDDFDVLLQQVCEQVVRAVPGVDGATVTVLLDGPVRTTNATSEVAAELDGGQYGIGT
ncbi:transcriptional regulator, partial [Actinosynnema sp. NPDC023658]